MIAERLGEGVGDAIHAADGLEHGGLPVDLFFVELSLGKVGGEEFGQVAEACAERIGQGRHRAV